MHSNTVWKVIALKAAKDAFHLFIAIPCNRA